MRSKTSYFNKALFCKNLTRFWPLWGGASFLGALVPLALLAQIVRGELWFSGSPAEFTGLYYEALCQAAPVLALLYTLLCAMAVWGYLCNARSTGLMHTLPIRREGLFCTGVLSGLAMVLIPCAVTGALCVLASLAAGGFDPAGLCVTVLGVLGLCVFYFASATLAAFITGNIFAIPALYFLLHFLKAFVDALVSMLAQGFIFGLDTGYSGALEFLSPTVYLLENLDFDCVREYVQESGTQYGYYKTVAVTLENGWLIAAYALAGLVLLALAYALYRRRNSERAGDVVSAVWMRPLFRYGIAALFALAGGQILYAVFFESGSMFGYAYGGGFQYRLLSLILCMVLAGAIGYYAASMLLAKSLRVFRGSWKGLACVAAGTAAVCLALYLDLPGIGARVPEIGEVREVTLRVAGNGYTFYPGEEDELLEEVRSLHRSIAEDRDYILNFWAEGNGASAAVGEWDTENVVLVYTLKDGRTMRRYYPLPLTRERIAQPDTFEWRLDQLVNGSAMRAKRLHLGDARYVPAGGYLSIDRSHESARLSDREAAAILEALGRDAAAGTWGTCEWFDRDAGGDYAIYLNLEFRQQTENGYRGFDSIDIVVRPGMTSTVACLLELDLVSGEDLVTYRELYPEDYAAGVEAWEAWDAPADTVVYPGEIIYPEEIIYPGETFLFEETDSAVFSD